MLVCTKLRNTRVRLPISSRARTVCFKCQKRLLASASGPASASSPATVPAKLSTLSFVTTELDRLAPRFEIDPSSVTVIRTPSEFYSILKARIKTAQSRVFLSTLYIGKSEYELVETLRESLRAHPKLKVSILSDALRSTRETPGPSCASLLAPLVEEFGAARVEIRMYHTPNLTGLRKWLMPKRLNEGWGLQHMKLYGVDDEIIISGANLSSEYFSNRQDRYHSFSSKHLTDYYQNLHEAIGSLSYRLVPCYEGGQQPFRLEWPSSNPAPQPVESPDGFRLAATNVLSPLIAAPKGQPNSKIIDSCTFVYPLAQFTPLLRPRDTSTERPALMAMLEAMVRDESSASRWLFTAGYFNIHPRLKQLLLDSRSRKGTVVTAAPEANGFYGSKGVSGMLPPAYTLLARRFLSDVISAGKSDAIELKEWKKGTYGRDLDAWTYHAKGVWLTMPGDESPSITLIGSSNYTKRSYSLDLEANALLITKDANLKQRLAEETTWLQEHTQVVTMDDFHRTERRVSLKVRLALWLVGILGGQL